jgi:hypothetical protein
MRRQAVKAATFIDGHPVRQEGKRIRGADGAPVFSVKLLTIQAQPRAAKLHHPSLRGLATRRM